jgi:hypothetical protein
MQGNSWRREGVYTSSWNSITPVSWRIYSYTLCVRAASRQAIRWNVLSWLCLVRFGSLSALRDRLRQQRLIGASPLALATHSWLESQDSMARRTPIIPTEYSVHMQWPGDEMRAGTFSYLPTWASLSRFGRHTTRASITGRLKCGKGELQASKLIVAPLQKHDCRGQGIRLAAVAFRGATPCNRSKLQALHVYQLQISSFLGELQISIGTKRPFNSVSASDDLLNTS